MNEVGKLDRVLNKENGDIVANQIEIALPGVELGREAAHITRQVAGAGAASNGGDAYEHRSLLADPLKEIGFGVLAQGLGQLEITVGARAAGMNDALGDALVVEMGDFLAQDEVFEQCWPARVPLQRILVVGDDDTLIGGQYRLALGGQLMQFASGANLGGWRMGRPASGHAGIFLRVSK